MKQSVITIGTFDGVHKGHQAILNKVVKIAKQNNLKSIVLSFENPVKQVEGLITTKEEKISYLSGFAIDEILLLPVEKRILSLTADKFFDDILAKKLKTKHIVVGYDCTFGKNRQGNIVWLKQKTKKFNIKLTVIKPIKINKQIVSSSKIRDLIIKNDIKNTNKMLNRFFSFSGKHISGDKIGTTLGFPTINLKVDDSKLLPRGVFSCIVSDKQNDIYQGVLNIGVRPTIKLKKHKLSVEIHLLNYSKVWKEKNPIVYIHEFIRKEQKFKNTEILKKTIQKDIKKCCICLID